MVKGRRPYGIGDLGTGHTISRIDVPMPFSLFEIFLLNPEFPTKIKMYYLERGLRDDDSC